MNKYVEGFLDFVTPRFITERVAVYKAEDGQWHVLCREVELRPSDEGEYDFIGEVRPFNFFGFAFGCKMSLPEGVE